MDIHRARFVPYQPSAINALAFSSTYGRALRGQPLKLAIGRADGDIEIWNPLRGKWIKETVIKGGKGRSCEGLVWTRDPDQTVVSEDGYKPEQTKKSKIYGRARLFSIGYSSAIVEWDLQTGLPRRESSGVGGEVWCLAAQPAVERKEKNSGKKKKANTQRLINGNNGASTGVLNGDTEKVNDKDDADNESQRLVAGCADGTLVMLSTEDDDLVFKKYIARASKKNARALSLCFKDRNTVVAGFSDSTIRVYDIRNGQLLRNMSLGGGPSGGPKEKLVWAVDCLKDGTIVSADSSGEVTFWDDRTYSILQRIKGHEADVLCLTSSQDGLTVFSGGMDRRTCVYTCTSEGQRKRWSKSTHRRFHQHDVKAMARFDSDKMSVVVSGGLDTTPILIPLRDFGKEYHRTLPFVPQTSPLAGASRFVISWKENEVTIWRIPKRKPEADEYDDEPAYNVAARLMLKAEEHISSVVISTDARLLVVATAAETRLFSIRPSKITSALRVRRVDIPAVLNRTRSRLMAFSPDSNWLLTVDASSQIHLSRLAPTTDTRDTASAISGQVRLRRLRRSREVQNCFNGDWGSYDRTITRCAFSSDSQRLAVSDMSGYIDTFELAGQEDLNALSLNQGAKTHNGTTSADSSSEENTSDSDSDVSMASNRRSRKSKRQPTVFNQNWQLTPTAHLIPKCPSQPTILSFRPTSSTTTSPSSGTIDHHLLVLTATHDLLLYSTHTGKLTDWSRRNPSTLLPTQFKIQRDRAIDCLWDVAPSTSTSDGDGPSCERLWLYGPSWLCMFALSIDFPRPKENPGQLDNNMVNGDSALVPTSNDTKSKKRKRPTNKHASLALPTQRDNTGAAGSSVPSHEQAGAIGTTRQKTGTGEWMDVHPSRRNNVRGAQSESDDDPDEDMEIDPRDEIAFLTRPVNGGPSETEGEGEGTSGDQEDDTPKEVEKLTHKEKRRLRKEKYLQLHGELDGEEGEGVECKGMRPPGYLAMDRSFFITSRYRPILGIVALGADTKHLDSDEHGEVDGGAEDVNGHGGHEGKRQMAKKEKAKPLEVVLVERPFWDLKLPPRFVGPQDWGEK